MRLAICVFLVSVLARPIFAQSGEAHTTTYLEFKSDQIGRALDSVRQYARAARADRGNREVVALQELGRPTRMVIMASWRDADAIAQQELAAYTHSFREKLKVLAASPADQRVTHVFLADNASTPPRSGSLFVVTHVDVPGAKREEAEALLKEMIGPSRLQAGHVRYDIYQQNDPRLNHFTLYAIWKGRAAFDASGSGEGALKFREKLVPILGALYDERLYRLIQ